MHVKEYRILLPLTLNEYQIGQLYTTVEISKQESSNGDGSGVEILKNEPYVEGDEIGQYTHKFYHLGSRVPKIVAKLAPSSSLKMNEEAWNSYPNCKTVIANEYLGDRFDLVVRTIHAQDGGSNDNIHGLSDTLLAKREIITIDLSGTALNPLCCYKLVTLRCDIKFVSGIICDLVMNYQAKMFNTFHKQMLDTYPKWKDMTIQEVRELEYRAKEELARTKENVATNNN
jgi:hypothetical protein